MKHMKHIKLFKDFLNESFNITSEKDDNYEKTDIVIDIIAGNSGFVGTVKGTYDNKKVDATIFYGYEKGSQFLSIEDDNLTNDDIEMLTDIIENDENFIKSTNE